MPVVNPHISVINLASTPLGFDLNTWVASAMQVLKTDFFPIWGLTATLGIETGFDPKTPANQLKYTGDYGFVFWDDADTPGALGYHDYEGKPLTHVFVKTTIGDGQDVSVTAFHELFEMLLDPPACLWAQNPKTNILWALEASDAVEETGYNKYGVNVSNFVTPSYFGYDAGKKYDYLGQCKAPFSILKGGYSILQTHGKVSQKMGSEEKLQRFLKEDRRLHRSAQRVKAAGHIGEIPTNG